MRINKWVFTVIILAAGGAGFAIRGLTSTVTLAAAPAADRVFELRTYTAAPGKFEDLKARFRNHTLRIFARHGLQAIGGYYIPADPPLSQNTLMYILVHESRAAADKNWAEFQADPEWVKERAASVANGELTTSPPTRLWLTPADFSPVK